MKKHMKKLYYLLLLMMVVLFPIHAEAIDFVPEEVYESIVTIYTSRSVGSGFAIDESLIATNAHVVKGAKSIWIETYEGKDSYSAEIVKIDNNIDLAVLRIHDKKMTPLPFAEDSTSIGQDVYAVGSPENNPYTMTRGIISAAERTIGGYSYIQTDASINPGNSGGPLLNEVGQVIGVNTWKIDGAEGMGFAIPVKELKGFISELEAEVGQGAGGENREDGDGGRNAGSEDENAGNGQERPFSDEDRYRALTNEVQVLRVAVIILSVAAMLLLLLLIRAYVKYKPRKKKNEFDFEIEFEE